MRFPPAPTSLASGRVSTGGPPPPPSAAGVLDPDLARKVADARALVEGMAKKRALLAAASGNQVVNPYLVCPYTNLGPSAGLIG